MSGALSCVRVPVPEFWWLVIAFAFLIVAGKCEFCSTFASSARKSGFSIFNFASRKKGTRTVCAFCMRSDVPQSLLFVSLLRGMLAQ